MDLIIIKPLNILLYFHLALKPRRFLPFWQHSAFSLCAHTGLFALFTNFTRATTLNIHIYRNTAQQHNNAIINRSRSERERAHKEGECERLSWKLLVNIVIKIIVSNYYDISMECFDFEYGKKRCQTAIELFA